MQPVRSSASTISCVTMGCVRTTTHTPQDPEEGLTQFQLAVESGRGTGGSTQLTPSASLSRSTLLMLQCAPGSSTGPCNAQNALVMDGKVPNSMCHRHYSMCSFRDRA